MFKLQQEITNQTHSLKELYKKYDFSLDKIESLNPQIENFQVRIPLIGAFSAGKSSLINRLIDQKLLCVEIDPASNLATEISFAEHEHIQGFKADKFVKNLTAEELKEQEFDDLMPDGHIEVRLNHQFLKDIPHLCLADLPGLDSKSNAHTQAIHHYIGRSLAYVIVVSSEEGTLKNSIKKFLQELAFHNAPILVILTKSDKRTAEEIEAIKQQIMAEVSTLLPQNNYLDVVNVSAKKKDISQAINAFYQLEALSEQRFNESVVPRFLTLIDNLTDHLSILMNKGDLDTEGLEQQKQQLEQETRVFAEKLAAEQQRMNEQLPSILNKILQYIQNRLMGDADSFTNGLIAQRNIENELSYSVRIALTEAMDQYFKPLVNKYIHRIESDLPSLIVNQNFHFEQGDNESTIFDSSLIGITSILAFVLKRFPLVAMILPIVTSIFKAFVTDSDRDQQREAQKEAARSHVGTSIIPQVLEQVRLSLGVIFQEQLNEVNQKVQNQIGEKIKQNQHSMAVLEQELQKNSQERAEQQVIYQQDLQILHNLKEKLQA